MKLSEQLKQDHESGDFGKALAGYSERVAELELDAERYRFIRDSKNAYPLFFIAQRDPNNVVVQFTGELADMNIDALMMQTEKLEA